jgi:hypothetical protein
VLRVTSVMLLLSRNVSIKSDPQMEVMKYLSVSTLPQRNYGSPVCRSLLRVSSFTPHTAVVIQFLFLTLRHAIMRSLSPRRNILRYFRGHLVIRYHKSYNEAVLTIH